MPKELKAVTTRRLGCEQVTFSKVVVCNYLRFELLTELSRVKATSLHVRRSYFGPSPCKRQGFGGAAGYRPRVRTAYYTHIYYHSSEEPFEYNRSAAKTEERGASSTSLAS